MSWEPTHLHITKGSTRLCGEKSKTWAEKYMSDKFARTLPLCLNCVTLREEKVKQPVSEVVTTPKPRKVIKKKRLFLADYRLSHIKEQQ